jgi:hypothetical protein
MSLDHRQPVLRPVCVPPSPSMWRSPPCGAGPFMRALPTTRPSRSGWRPPRAVSTSAPPSGRRCTTWFVRLTGLGVTLTSSPDGPQRRRSRSRRHARCSSPAASAERRFWRRPHQTRGRHSGRPDDRPRGGVQGEVPAGRPARHAGAPQAHVGLVAGRVAVRAPDGADERLVNGCRGPLPMTRQRSSKWARASHSSLLLRTQ